MRPNAKIRPELLKFRVKPLYPYGQAYQPLRPNNPPPPCPPPPHCGQQPPCRPPPHCPPQPSQCCNPCDRCNLCLCYCQRCIQTCRECHCRPQQQQQCPQEELTPEHYTDSPENCVCAPCKYCKGCVCECDACRDACDLCICPEISQIPCKPPRPPPAPKPCPKPLPTPPPKPCPPPPSQCMPCDDYDDCQPHEEFDLECRCSQCEHCEGCRCKCRLCKQNCPRCSCARILKDPRICATSRVVDQGWKNKYVFIIINICSRQLIKNFQIYLDLQSAFTDKDGQLVCLDKDKIGISASPLEVNPDYDGKLKTGILDECQQFQPGNMKITINLSGIPSDWCINPLPITVTGRICNQQLRISTCVEGEECC